MKIYVLLSIAHVIMISSKMQCCFWHNVASKLSLCNTNKKA